MSFRLPNSRFCVFERKWFPKGTPYVIFRKFFQKNRVIHVIRLILRWKSRIRWDQFDILPLNGLNLKFLFKNGYFWPKWPILTKSAKFDPLRVEILNLSQRIRDFQRKISRITCLTRYFWKYFWKVAQGVPCGILSIYIQGLQ